MFRDFCIQTSNITELRPYKFGAQFVGRTVPTLKGIGPIVLRGNGLAHCCVAAWALSEGQTIVVATSDLNPDCLILDVTSSSAALVNGMRSRHSIECDYDPWQLGFYTSGSTGTPKAWAFNLEQLKTVVDEYRDIYKISENSVIITHLPSAYNFPFIAGVLLAATSGATLHLSSSAFGVFADARRLAGRHDRCVILANPVLLETPPPYTLGEQVLIDTGGAPMSRFALAFYRNKVADIREGYGLTETASLTHFDYEGSVDSLGTVGAPLRGMKQWCTPDGEVIIECKTLGRPLSFIKGKPTLGPSISAYATGDLGRIDSFGRLRLLGRVGDCSLAGVWPKDTLDAIGPLLETRTAMVRHHLEGRVTIRLRSHVPEELYRKLVSTVADTVRIPHEQVFVQHGQEGLLPSIKIPRDDRISFTDAPPEASKR